VHSIFDRKVFNWKDYGMSINKRKKCGPRNIFYWSKSKEKEKERKRKR